MKINNLLSGLKSNGFSVRLVIDHDVIKNEFKVMNEHDYLLVVYSADLNNANAEIAYGFNVTDKGVAINHYNRHCIRNELGRVYTLHHTTEEEMTSSIISNASTLSKSLISLFESSKND